MEVVDLARLQFEFTTIFHYVYVPISIGLSLIVAIMETLYVVKKDGKFKRMAQFWGTFLLINFAVGIVTGMEAMDEILFLERGTAIMRGSHEELMAHYERYRSLHRLDQFA